MLYGSSLVSRELISISTRLVCVSLSFLPGELTSLHETYELPVPEAIRARQVTPSTFTVRTGNSPLLLPLAVITVFSPLFSFLTFDQ